MVAEATAGDVVPSAEATSGSCSSVVVVGVVAVVVVVVVVVVACGRTGGCERLHVCVCVCLAPLRI